jgi:hypothetical protein
MTGLSSPSIAREACVSFAINAVLSLAFFLGVFGLAVRSLTWGKPDALAFDFVPQSIAVALMSALVPALVMRRRLGLAVAVRAILIRAVAFAIAGAALGGLLAWAAQAGGWPPIAKSAALAGKMIYGGLLGALITTLTLRRML